MKQKYYMPNEKTPEDVFYRVATVLSIPDVIDYIIADLEPLSPGDVLIHPPEELFKEHAEIFERTWARKTDKPLLIRDTVDKISTIHAMWDKYIETYYTAISDLDFMPATPLLMNAGKPGHMGMLASCFFLQVEDSLLDIFSRVKDVAWISKLGGGVGLDMSNLRPQGTPVRSTNGKSSGPISFLNVFNETGNTVVQGGFRRSALLAALRVDHPDIVKFIQCKSVEGKLSNFNISVLLSNTFMRSLGALDSTAAWECTWKDKIYYIAKETGEPIEVGKSGKVYDKISNEMYYTAKEIWKLIINHAWSNGEPGILFDDHIQNGDIFKGKFGRLGVNPCQPKDAILLDDNRLREIHEAGKTWKSWRTGIKEVFKYTCTNGLEIRCTQDHKIMLENEKLVPIKDSIGKNIKWGLGNRKYALLDRKHILLGFLFGDGFRCGCGHGVGVKINENKEQEVAKLLREFGFKKQKSGGFYRNRMNLELDLDFNLEFLDHPVYSRNIPNQIIFGNTNVVASFLVGLWSANGSCSKIGMGSLKSTNIETIKIVQILLSSFGVPAWICPNKKNKTIWKNGTYTSKQSYNLQIAGSNMKFFRDNIGGFLHKHKMDNIRDTGREYTTKLTIIKQESLGEQEVWDYQMHQPPHYNLCQGVILSNCGELPLLSYESCILGAINLSNLVKDHKIDFEKLKRLVTLGVRFLDNAIDVNTFPLPEIEHASLRGRKIGLGSMGLHDLLLKLGISYGDAESIEIIDMLYGKMRAYAEEASKDLAKIRGIPPELAQIGIMKRNSGLLTVQPTGTVSLFCGCSSGIEPNFEWEYERNDSYGKATMRHFMLDLYKDKLPNFAKTAMEILPEEHVKVQGTVQRHIDSSISKTCNVPNHATEHDIDKIYRLAYDSMCKSITVYRSGSRKTEVLSKKEEPIILEDKKKRDRPRILYGATYRINTPGGKAYITVNEDRDGIREVFIHISKAGSEIQTHIEAEGRLISNSLKYRMPVNTIIDHLIDHKSNPIFDNGNLVKSVPDAVAKVMQEFKNNLEGFSQYLENNPEVQSIYTQQGNVKKQTGDLCPECGEVVYTSDTCPVCISCGYSQCG